MRPLCSALALLLAACGADEPAPPRSVAVDATATLHVPPDTAAITLTFGADHDDLRTAHATVEDARTGFLARVERFDARVESGAIRYAPHRPHVGAAERMRASQTVVVHTAELDDVPRIIAEGGPTLTGVHVRHYVADRVQHRSRLRQMAIDAAQSKAGDLASGFGGALGRVQTIAEGGATSHAAGVGNLDNSVARVTVDDDGVPPPGAIPLRVTLRVTFALEDA